MKRRQFNKLITSVSSAIVVSNGYSISRTKQKYGLSLAQWSLNKMIKTKKTLNPINFAQKASELGFNAIEYVSTLYRLELEKMNISELTKKLISNSKNYNIKNLLIMVDQEGDLSSSNPNEILQAVDKHMKWIEMANELGCHSVRVNLNGENNIEKCGFSIILSTIIHVMFQFILTPLYVIRSLRRCVFIYKSSDHFF